MSPPSALSRAPSQYHYSIFFALKITSFRAFLILKTPEFLLREKYVIIQHLNIANIADFRGV